MPSCQSLAIGLFPYTLRITARIAVQQPELPAKKELILEVKSSHFLNTRPLILLGIMCIRWCTFPGRFHELHLRTSTYIISVVLRTPSGQVVFVISKYTPIAMAWVSFAIRCGYSIAFLVFVPRQLHQHRTWLFVCLSSITPVSFPETIPSVFPNNNHHQSPSWWQLSNPPPIDTSPALRPPSLDKMLHVDIADSSALLTPRFRHLSHCRPDSPGGLIENHPEDLRVELLPPRDFGTRYWTTQSLACGKALLDGRGLVNPTRPLPFVQSTTTGEHCSVVFTYIGFHYTCRKYAVQERLWQPRICIHALGSCCSQS